MKNWNTLEADIDLIMNTHYTPGRNGRQIDKVIIHHNAGNLTIRGCYDVWQTCPASAHYQVQTDGTIGSSCGIVTPPGMQATLPPTPPVSASNTPT